MKSANQKIEKGDMTMYISIKKIIFTMYISTSY